MINLPASEYILETSREYSLYVCRQRAIPLVSDGLKDSQRKAMYCMKKVNGKLKTSALIGDMIGSNLYIHGEKSASDAVCNLAAEFLNNYPLLKGLGSFGTKLNNKEFGATRYTSIKKPTYLDDLLYADYDLIEYKENYDGTVLEPVNFLPIVPLVLLNGISGIAVGWSTEILPHDINDITDVMISILSGKKYKNILPSYGKYECDVKELSENSYQICGKTIHNGNTLTITEIPPQLNLEDLHITLDELIEKEIIKDYIDNSTNNVNIVVKLNKSIPVEEVIKQLKINKKITQRLVTINFDNNSIKRFKNIYELIEAFIEYRLKFYYKRYQKLIKDLSDDLSFEELLLACFNNKLSEKILKQNNKQECYILFDAIKQNIPNDIKDKILNKPTYFWTLDNKNKTIANIEELKTKIKEYNIILKDDNKIKSIYIDELKKIKTDLNKYVKEGDK